MRLYRVILTGLGNVGLNFLRLLVERDAIMQSRYGLTLKIVGVADTSGVLTSERGLDLAQIISLKEQRLGVASLGRSRTTAVALVQECAADVLLDATPNDLKTGQPGLDLARTALKKGMHVVLASKSPLVIAYQELAALSTRQSMLRFSGAVCGAMPTVNVGRRDLAASNIQRVEAVLNTTTQIILWLMSSGSSYDEALTEARRMGVVETDPSFDVDGWDTANKLVIIANSVLNFPAKLNDVVVKGIRTEMAEDLQKARREGQSLILLGLAEQVAEGAYYLSVQPTLVNPSHPLGRLGLDEMGIVYHTDLFGRVTVTSAKQGPIGASAAMLRDVIDIHMSSI